ncbi:hypothetical protein [Oceanospirillum sediminis]|uniref:Uncharacterized protein n=1 Tax=Oceanospirillum sediminis TaxID=2760088 RepID=A0A839IVK6_9GAMM|nr:hypothetical protein [Oceanospirillum sediminis]MBB1488437.1 hypothetical protein [Oceanospirillum sediminis]
MIIKRLKGLYLKEVSPKEKFYFADGYPVVKFSYSLRYSGVQTAVMVDCPYTWFFILLNLAVVRCLIKCHRVYQSRCIIFLLPDLTGLVVVACCSERSEPRFLSGQTL